MDPANARRWLDRASWIGPVALFTAAWAWSVLDAEFSTDTWLGLAAGRQLAEQLDWRRFHESFPRHDTFSYTFYGQLWFNQNWLSNLGQYWVYDRIGPSGVVYVTWAIAAGIQVLVLLAVRWRTQSWLAAWLAAGVVGIGGRDFLEPRAAIVGLLCLAALWALLCAIDGQRDRRRAWPIVLFLPLLVFWSCAHGGFTFGYGLLGLYVAHWVAVRLGLRFGASGAAASAAQIAAIAGVLAAATAIALTLGPFGIASFAHPGKIASSAIFRTVSEWHPAYSRIGSAFPPMWRFWAILALTSASGVLLWMAGRWPSAPPGKDAPRGAPAPWSLFDVAVVVIGVGMTLWARRFAPLLYVLSAPVLAVAFVRLAGRVAPRLQGYGGLAVKLAAALAAIVTGLITWTAAQRDLVAAFRDRPATGLLERTRGYAALDDAARFIGVNRLRVNVLADYGYGGSVMFHAPLARVFIDGRSDQLYTEQHFRRYWTLMDGRTPAGELRRILDETKTDAVLTRNGFGAGALRNTLLHSPEWVVALLNPDFTLFLRHGSPALTRLGERVREGSDERPGEPGTAALDIQAARANVLLNTSPADRTQALARLEEAVDRAPRLGRIFHPAIARGLEENAGIAAATDYLRRQINRVTFDATLDPATRSDLLASLAESLARLAGAARDPTGSPGRLPAAGTGLR